MHSKNKLKNKNKLKISMCKYNRDNLTLISCFKKKKCLTFISTKYKTEGKWKKKKKQYD
jgi:hypothetical protein